MKQNGFTHIQGLAVSVFSSVQQRVILRGLDAADSQVKVKQMTEDGNTDQRL